MVNAHRQAWTWQDEWYGLTMTEIRRLEAEAAAALAAKMGDDAPTLTNPATGPPLADEAISLVGDNVLVSCYCCPFFVSP